MPGGMTGENPFATVGTDANLRGNQRQAAALAAGLSPPHQGHVGAINLAPTLVPVAAQQSPVASLGALQLKQLDLEAAASQLADPRHTQSSQETRTGASLAAEGRD